MGAGQRRALHHGGLLIHVVDHFANPAITVARSLSNSFAGIAPADAPLFILPQFAGATAGAEHRQAALRRQIILTFR